jgi:hypothetical protein
MHGPTPPSRDRDRERWRAAKRRQRAREIGGIRRAPITYGPTVVKAIIAQGRDAGLSEEEACRQSRNRKKIAAALGNLIEEWACAYLVGRGR